ncbi:unnamed protein product [Gulo gulo]|uniref:Uncharacterized protein n=1 Tax=Gulo gulo TaxID=48420 RepID=A0A9X9Q3S8_GULGU|nr:unnamed protein product [Gulo gulo]
MLPRQGCMQLRPSCPVPETSRSLRFSQDAPLEAGADGKDVKSFGPWKLLPMNHEPVLLKTQHFLPAVLDCAHNAF